MNQPLRALVGARVSALQGPQKVSHIAQQETGAKWATEHGHEITGSIQDLGVSASVSPFERPDLGPWLSPEKAHEWDVLVFSKLDRLFRSTRDCVKFAEWAEQNRKILVFAEDGLTLNYRDRDKTSVEGMMAELFVYLGSFFAQLELNRFKSRANDRLSVLRQTDRWSHGMPPLGFKVVDHPSGKGKGLDTDQEGKELLHQMAAKLLGGWSFRRIADWLNETGAQSNRSRARAAKGKDSQAKWTVPNVQAALTLPRTQGLKMHKGTTVLDAKGEPIRLAPATFDHDTWTQIQAVAELRKLNRRTPTKNANPMLGIGFCGAVRHAPDCLFRPEVYGVNTSVESCDCPVCGSSLALKSYKRERNYGTYTYRYYCCGRTPRHCKNVMLRADVCEELLEETFLQQWGDRQVTSRVFVPGEDHSHELDQVNASIARLRRESDAGLVVTADDEEEWLGRMKSLVDRRTTLEALPSRAAGWVTEETGQTYAEVWPDADKAQRRQLLIDHGIRFELHSAKPLKTHTYVPWMIDENRALQGSRGVNNGPDDPVLKVP
jgi:site-specific DNA recombinase